ncbi:pinin/SDK/memA/ protein conserved region-domain-containing protein [Fennellomyces sp. T-0311]|nr:pinin/SDK/memA/ protein conserved region-domain-containing protein [Fennellomyces sp. T-0311]
MVKSSIVVPSQSAGSSARKRSIDQEDGERNGAGDTGGSEGPGAQETKKPRLEMNADNKRRGQRMFGVLLGTLNKFKDDSKNKSEAEKKREEIDSKLHEKLANEKKELAEKIQADRERRERETSVLRKREQRLIEEKSDATCVQQKEHLANYIKTTASPQLYYRPKKLTDSLAKLIDEQTESARTERKAYEERKEERMKEEEAEDKAAAEAGEKRQPEDEASDREPSPHLESPAPEDAVVADRDE